MLSKFASKLYPISLAILYTYFLSGCSFFNQIQKGKKESNAQTQGMSAYDVTIKRKLDFLPSSVTDIEDGYQATFKQIKHFNKMTLKNGLEIYIQQRHDIPEVSVAIIVESGKHQLKAIDERLSPLALKFLKQGTKKYSKKELQKRMAWLGRPIIYKQTARFSVISTQILPQDIGFALDLLSQQLAHTMPDDQTTIKVIEQQLLENKLSESSGSYLTKLLFYQKNYPVNHLYYSHQPNSKEIKRVTRDDLIDFYERKYRANRSTIIISGDIELSAVNQQIQHYFADWDAPPYNQKTDSQYNIAVNSLVLTQNAELKSKHKEPVLNFIERKGSQQIDLLYGVVTVPRTSSDWISLKMIATLLGGGPSSRLFNDLREKQGLAYYISAQQTAGLYSSPFLIQTSIAHDKLVPAIRGISNHLNYLCKNEITKSELIQIKQQLRRAILFKLQTNSQMVTNKIQQLENSLSDDYLDEFKNQIPNISSQQLLTVANKYLCGPAYFIAAGDTSQLENNFHDKLSDYHYTEYQLPLHQ